MVAILSKLASWNGKSLSIAGHLTLIKLVISGAFIHSFFIYKWLAAIIKELNTCIRNFLWIGYIFERKLVTVAWHRVGKSMVNGEFCQDYPRKFFSNALLLVRL